MKEVILGAVVGASALALSSLYASAAVVCTGNVCWHAQETYDYPPEARVVAHENNWAPAPGITFREHEGRGYWRGDRWTAW